MPKKKQEEYVPDEVEQRKQLMLMQAKRYKLEPWPEDTRRIPAGKVFAEARRKEGEESKAARLREIAEWYLLCGGSFLIRLHHSWIADKVWDHFEKPESRLWAPEASGYGLTHIQKNLQEAGKWWVDRITPHAGGLLEPVELQEAGDAMLNAREKLYACTFNAHPYYFPGGQCDLVWQFYPEAGAFLARDLEGYDLWGNQVIRSCPLTFVVGADSPDDGRKVVAFAMPLHWR